MWTKKNAKKSGAFVPATSRTVNHLTLFVIVSAYGFVVDPAVLLYGNLLKGYNNLPEKRHIRCYNTVKGYMTKERFFEIMRDVFVKHVESVREQYGLEGQRAVLVVDGHLSRYSVKTIDLLMEHNIHLLILPAHSSHITQPLDLGLNRLLKMRFRELLPRMKPKVLLSAKKQVGRPPKKRCRRGSLNAPSHEQLMVTENADLLRARSEDPTETRSRIGNAGYERAKIIAAVMDALQILTRTMIQNAWNATHLYPFSRLP